MQTESIAPRAQIDMFGDNAAGVPTVRGFEPLRAEPNGFLVHHLSHSVTLSVNKFPDGKLYGIGSFTLTWGGFWVRRAAMTLWEYPSTERATSLCRHQCTTLIDRDGGEPLMAMSNGFLCSPP